MNIIRKITGYLLLLVGAFFSFIMIGVTINAVNDTIAELNISTAEGIGYGMGSFLMISIFILIIFFILKKGFSLVRREKVYENSINEIGSGL